MTEPVTVPSDEMDRLLVQALEPERVAVAVKSVAPGLVVPGEVTAQT
jgi:hypothetical protein